MADPSLSSRNKTQKPESKALTPSKYTTPHTEKHSSSQVGSSHPQVIPRTKRIGQTTRITRSGSHRHQRRSNHRGKDGNPAPSRKTDGGVIQESRQRSRRRNNWNRRVGWSSPGASRKASR